MCSHILLISWILAPTPLLYKTCVLGFISHLVFLPISLLVLVFFHIIIDTFHITSIYKLGGKL